MNQMTKFLYITLWLLFQSLSPGTESYKHPQGGTQIWIGWGCAAVCSKPIPMFRGNFFKNRYPYLRNFLKKGTHFLRFCSKNTRFSKFHGVHIANLANPRKVLKSDLQLGILSLKIGPMFMDFLQKPYPKLRHIPVCLNI